MKLEAANVELKVIEYLTETPSTEDLDSILKQLKIEPQDLVRRVRTNIECSN